VPPAKRGGIPAKSSRGVFFAFGSSPVQPRCTCLASMARGLPLITMAMGSLMYFLALFALSSAFMVSINPSSNKRGEVSYRPHQRRSSCSHLQAKKKKKKGPASDALAQLEALEALEVLEVEGESASRVKRYVSRSLSLVCKVRTSACMHVDSVKPAVMNPQWKCSTQQTSLHLPPIGRSF